LSTDIKVARGVAPAAGFAQSTEAPASVPRTTQDWRVLISGARKLGQEIVDVSHRGASLSIADIGSLLSVRLRQMLPHESMALYCPKSGVLVPEFVSGENFRLFSSLKIPLGEGLSGWVAQNHKPILNGNPSVEPGYLNDPTKYSTLRSALAVPLEGSSGVAAVLALYRAGQDAFSADDLRIASAIGSGLGSAIESAAKPRAAGVGAAAK